MKSKTTYVNHAGKMVYDNTAYIQQQYLDRKPGKYRIRECVVFIIPEHATDYPFFEVRVSKGNHSERLELASNFLVKHASEYELMHTLALQKYQQFRNMLDNADGTDLLEVEIAAATERKEAKERARRARLAQSVTGAANDVQTVLAMYGPHLRMNQPYFTYQWI